MKLGAEDRKKAIIAGVLGLLAVVFAVYNLADFGGGGSTPSTPTPVPVQTAQLARGPAAQKISGSRLDPTLHPEGMLLAEQLVYAGSGRNIFSATNEVPVAKVVIPKPITGPRTETVAQALPTGPPPPPPIDMRFFGIVTRADGSHQAFFLRGEDVLIAATGDVVSRRYKVGVIAATSVEVTDLTNNNSQRLPLVLQ